jgi:hypothetical protein
MLVMDDNHFLTEWLAYHYHVLPLRRLVLAQDPRSLTSAHAILQRWNNTGLMTITVWHDVDYIVDDAERQAAEYWVRAKFPESSESLVQHRARQRLFYYKCMQHLKREGQSWCLLTDSDEYLRVNYALVESLALTAPSLDTAGSVGTFLEQDRHRPGQNLTTTPCIQIPRLRFGVMESANNNSQPKFDRDIPPAFNASTFATLRWRYRSNADNRALNRVSKVLLDLQRVSWDKLVPVDSIHRPVRSLCGHRRLYIQATEQVLVVHHYLGSWEQYSFRNDSRKGVQRSREVRYFVLYICIANTKCMRCIVLIIIGSQSVVIHIGRHF